MKKSPFSTPRGNAARSSFGWNSGGSPGRGYGRSKNTEIFSPNRSQFSPQNLSGSEDFISLDSCTPPSSQNRRNSGSNWHSPRGHWQGNGGGRDGRRQSASPGYKSYRDHRQGVPSQNQSGGKDFISLDSCTPPLSQNHRNSGGNWQNPQGQRQGNGGRGGRGQSASPGYNNYRDYRSRNHHQTAPYFVDMGKQFHGQRKNFQRGKGSHNRAHISRYVNLYSFLEDPWAELTRKLKHESSNQDSQNDTSADLSFNTVLGDVCLDDSVNSASSLNRSSKEAIEGPMELDNSFVRTSQELADEDESFQGSKNPKPSQDSND